MTDEDAFTAAIRANPADRAARGAFADWLDDHGRHPDAARQRVCADPDSNALRLAFADACEGAGDAARAEFVRVQVELAGLPAYSTVEGHITAITRSPRPIRAIALVGRKYLAATGPLTIWHRQRDDTWVCMSGMIPRDVEDFDGGRIRVTFDQMGESDPHAQRRWDLMAREKELYTANACDWYFRLPGADQFVSHATEPFGTVFGEDVWLEQHFRRGFIAEARCNAADWLAHADDLLLWHPVRAVRLTTVPNIQHSWESKRLPPAGETVIHVTSSWGNRVARDSAILTDSEVSLMSVMQADLLARTEADQLLSRWFPGVAVELPSLPPIVAYDPPELPAYRGPVAYGIAPPPGA